MASMPPPKQHLPASDSAGASDSSFGTPPEELQGYTGAERQPPTATLLPWGVRVRSRIYRWIRRNHGKDSARQPLPPPQPIHELGADSNRMPVPEALEIPERSGKGAGAIFVGREQVLRDIEAFLKQKRTENDAFALLLTNAPGSGKSTIIDELRFRRAQAGQPLIQLAPGAFLSEQKLLEALQATDLWQRSLGQKAAIWAATRGIGLIGWIGESHLRLTAVLKGVPVRPYARFKRWRQVADRLHELTEREPPTTVEAALRAVDRACRRGWIIAVDECNFWDEHQHNETVRSLLYEVADPTKRDASNLAHGGLLLCGLSNAQQATDRLTLSRAKIERLPPLDDAEVALLIRTHLDRAGAPPAITDRWTETLTRDFGKWTQHAQRAASVAAEMIRRTYALRLDADTRERTWDHRLQLVREQTAGQIVKLYGRIAAKAQKLIGSRALLELAESNQRTGGRIAHEQCMGIIRRGLARGERQRPEAQGERAVERDLMAMGLLHEHEIVDDQQSSSTWSIPMGSLTRHILARVKDTEPPDDNDDQERTQQTQESVETNRSAEFREAVPTRQNPAPAGRDERSGEEPKLNGDPRP